MIRLRKFSLKKFLIGALTAVIFCTLTSKASAQEVPTKDFKTPLTKADSIRAAQLLNSSDSLRALNDSTQFFDDSMRVISDTFTVRLSKDSLAAPVHYAADDSVVVMIQNKKIILYGKTKTDYQDINLEAPKVEIDQQTQILTAVNARDSTGSVLEEAKFTQGEQSFTSDTIQFNFKTQKGLTRNTITQTGEYFVHGKDVKKVSDEVTFIKEGFFTTCNLDDPHFGFKANKLKVVNKKVAISGPTHPEFEDVPIPIYLPFGYFPMSQGRHSGLLPPQFATNDQMGLGLENLGYYKVINDYWDAKLYGNVYSYGSWSANINPTYVKRYRYRGSFNFGLMHTKRNFKGDPDYYVNNSYTLTWNHAVDSRARPGTNFSANVNASSTPYNENVPNNVNQNFQNQLASSITYSKSWIDKPFNLTLSANHNQNNQTRLVNIRLPDAGFTVATVYPFQKKDFAGSKKWYEQLGIAYNGTFTNQLSFYDTAFRVNSLLDTLQWGAQHNIPITLSLPPILGGAVVVSPSVSYSQVWLQRTMTRTWNDATQKEDTTYNKGLFIDQRASFGVSFNTAMFGTFQFRNSKVAAIRHVVRPTISAAYSPDLSAKYYDSVKTIYGDYQSYSKLAGNVYGGYGRGESGGLSFQLDNNLEMKVRTNDSTSETGYKKVRLIDGFGVTTAYNFLADEFKLAPFQFYFRTNLFDKINLNATSTVNPYQVNSLGRDTSIYAWKGGHFTLGRMTNASISLSTSFQSKPKDPEKDKQRREQLDQQLNDPALAADRQRLLDYMRQNPAEFVDFNIPWQISFSYSLYYSRTDGPNNTVTKDLSSSASFSGSFSLTPKWNFSVNGFYDFDTRALQTFTMSIAREMHCWQMSINVTPVGPYHYFSFSINPKSSLLQDLRINRTRSFTQY